MDTKITKKRLKEMMEYELFKFVIFVVLIIFAWNLILSMTATRMMPSQQFTILNYYTNRSLTDEARVNFRQRAKDGLFSYQVIQHIQYDIAANADYSYMLMEGYIVSGEGNLMFLPNLDDKKSQVDKDENGNEQYRRTHIETFVMQFRPYTLRLDGEDGYFAQMESFLNRFYEGGFENGVLNEQEVKEYFLKNVKESKDKRFKTQEQKNAGALKEIERLQKYRNALVDFYQYKEAGYVEFVDISVQIGSGVLGGGAQGGVLVEGQYALNLCPNEATMGDLKEEYSYAVQIPKEPEDEQEDGQENEQEEYQYTAKDMCVVFLNPRDNQPTFEYEDLLYVVALLDTYAKPSLNS